MENTAVKIGPLQGASDIETQRRVNSRLGRRARDRESLREMKAILDRVYGRRRS